MRVFFSHSHADRALAARLRRSLEEEGVTFNIVDEPPVPGNGWRSQVEEAINSADAILLLLSSPTKVDEPQRLSWMLALQSVWENPAKRWIPILLKDAELPAFARSGAAGKDVEAIRIRDPKNLGPAIHAILRTLGGISNEQLDKRKRERETYEAGWNYATQEKSAKDAYHVGRVKASPNPPGGPPGYGAPTEPARLTLTPPRPRGAGEPAPFDAIPLDSDPIEIYPAVTAEDRARQRESFDAIRKYAESLKR
jgi:hypothetical protein